MPAVLETVMPAGRPIAAILAAALLASTAALAQVDGAPPGMPPSMGAPSPPDITLPGRDIFGLPDDEPLQPPGTQPPGTSDQGEPSQQQTPATPDTGPADTDLAPNALAIRAQYDAGMKTVDSGIAILVPFVGRTVVGLKRLALGRIGADPSIAEMQRRQVVAGWRDLALAEQRLRALDGILDRWRLAPPTSPPEQAAMLAGVHQRMADVAIVRRHIACGRYFSQVAGRAIQSGATRSAGVRIPPGC